MDTLSYKSLTFLLLLTTNLIKGQVTELKMTTGQESVYKQAWLKIDYNIGLAAKREKLKLVASDPDMAPGEIDNIFRQQYDQFKPKAGQYLKALLLTEVPKTPKTQFDELSKKAQNDLKRIWDGVAESPFVTKRSTMSKRTLRVGGAVGKVASNADNIVSNALRGAAVSADSAGKEVSFTNTGSLFGSSSTRGTPARVGGRSQALKQAPETGGSFVRPNQQPAGRQRGLEVPTVPQKATVPVPANGAPAPRVPNGDLEKAAKDLMTLEGQLQASKSHYKFVSNDLSTNPLPSDADDLVKRLYKTIEKDLEATGKDIKNLEAKIAAIKSTYGAAALRKAGFKVKVKRAIKIAVGVVLISAVGFGLFGGLFAYFHGNP